MPCASHNQIHTLHKIKYNLAFERHLCMCVSEAKLSLASFFAPDKLPYCVAPAAISERERKQYRETCIIQLTGRQTERSSKRTLHYRQQLKVFLTALLLNLLILTFSSIYPTAPKKNVKLQISASKNKQKQKKIKKISVLILESVKRRSVVSSCVFFN